MTASYSEWRVVSRERIASSEQRIGKSHSGQARQPDRGGTESSWAVVLRVRRLFAIRYSLFATLRGYMASSMRIGTRGSPLALAQARTVRDALAGAHGLDPDSIELSVIRTSGDAVQDRALTDIGGKGLFTKEIDQALIEGTIDLAVHSAKDLPTVLPLELVIAGYLPREDVRDAFISRKAMTLAELATGAVVGTASLRRQAMVKRLRPDLAVTLLRGNVETRLRRLEEGAVDATLLAIPGLNRLGRADAATS